MYKLSKAADPERNGYEQRLKGVIVLSARLYSNVICLLLLLVIIDEQLIEGWNVMEKCEKA